MLQDREAAIADPFVSEATAAASTEVAVLITRSRDGSAANCSGAAAVNSSVAAAKAVAVAAEAQEPADEAEAAAATAASTRKAWLARASSHHGHRLHKIFYPHDKHRRSSFCNAQWDDFIDTSAHSFSSSAAAAAEAIAASPDDAAGDSAACGAGDEGAAGAACSVGGGLLGLVHAGSMRTSMVSSGSFSQLQQSLRRRPSATATVLAGADGTGVVPRGPHSFSMNGASAALAQQAVLASLADADQQAPAAVLSTAASGSVHLLAATDFEDMIALGPTPSNALSSLGLIMPAADAAAAAAVGARSCSFSGAAASCGLQGCGTAASGGEAAAGRALSTLTGSNLDDFIATSATPGGRVSLLHVSRTSSSANMAGATGSARCTASPPPSPGGTAAAAGSSSTSFSRSFSSSLVVTMSSPRPSIVKGAAAGLVGQPVAAAADATGKPVGLGAKLAARLSCVLPGDGGSVLQHAATSLPADFQREGCSTPTGGRKVLWADEAAEPAGGRSSRPASGCGSGARSCTCGSSAEDQTCLQSEGARQQRDASVTLQRCSTQQAAAQPLQQAARQQAGSAASGSQFYVPPSGVLSGEMPCCPTGVLASKAALASGVLRHRSTSCSPGDLRVAAAGTMGQQQQQQSNRSGRPAYVGRRSSSSSGASPVFEAAVPFGAISGGLLRRGGTASQSMANLGMAGAGSAGMLQGPGVDSEDEIVTRQRAKSFTAGTSPMLAAGSCKHGALTPTRVAAASVLQRSWGV